MGSPPRARRCGTTRRCACCGPSAKRAAPCGPTSPPCAAFKTGGHLLDVALADADAVRAAVEAGIDCIEHGFLIDDDVIALMVKRGTFPVPTTYLADGMDVSAAGPEPRAKGASMFPRTRATARAAVQAWTVASARSPPCVPTA